MSGLLQFWVEGQGSGRIPFAGERTCLWLCSVEGQPFLFALSVEMKGISCILKRLAPRIVAAASLPPSRERRGQQTCYAMRASVCTVAIWQIHQSF